VFDGWIEAGIFARKNAVAMNVIYRWTPDFLHGLCVSFKQAARK
jgi:hypothetical protein